MDEVVYQEYGFCLIIFGHMCSWIILKMSDFIVAQGGGTP